MLGQANGKFVSFWRLNILSVSLNSKSDAKVILNIYTPELSTNCTELFDNQFRNQVLDNTKTQKETLEMIKKTGKAKKKPFASRFPEKNKQSPRGSAGNRNRNLLRQHF